jgi:hypothetical protein
MLDYDILLRDLPIKTALLKHSNLYNLPKEHLFLAFLTAYASCLPRRFELHLNLEDLIIPSLFTILIGEPTAGKSEIIRPFLTPLQQLENEHYSSYVKRKKEYIEFCEDWRKLSKKERHQLYLNALEKLNEESDFDRARILSSKKKRFGISSS